MLLGNKKSKPDEKNWCIVLNAIQSELDKKRFAQKIAAIFSLSAEESADLVVSTPIILLDNLSQKIANQLKDYLSSDGTQLVLTNDIFLKRKCYRTVWPEPPNLSFLMQYEEVARPEDHQKLLDPDEALNALKLQKDEPKTSLQEAQNFVEEAVSRVQEKTVEPSLKEELRKSRQESLFLRQENAKLRSEVEKIRKELSAVPAPKPETVSGAEKKNGRDIQELKAILTNLEEKHEVLKEEYRDARGIFEDRVKKASLEIEQLSRKNAELTDRFKKLDDEQKNKTRDASDLSEHHKKLKDEHEQTKRVYEERLAASARAMEVWKDKTETLSRRIEDLENQKPVPGVPYPVHEQEIEVWKEKYSGLERELNLAIRNHQAEKVLRQNMEAKWDELQAQNEKLAAELEKSSRDVKSWEKQFKELDAKVSGLRASYEEREGAVRELRQQLDSREAEIQRLNALFLKLQSDAEVRDAEREVQEVETRLSLQEKRLKELVAEQDIVERHIREREESIRKILSEQQLVEKQIMEQRQRKRMLDERKKHKKSPGDDHGSTHPDSSGKSS